MNKDKIINQLMKTVEINGYQVEYTKPEVSKYVDMLSKIELSDLVGVIWGNSGNTQQLVEDDNMDDYKGISKEDAIIDCLDWAIEWELNHDQKPFSTVDEMVRWM